MTPLTIYLNDPTLKAYNAGADRSSDGHQTPWINLIVDRKSYTSGQFTIFDDRIELLTDEVEDLSLEDIQIYYA